MYVCIYVYVYVCMYVYIYVCVCVCGYECVCMYICICVCACVYIYMCVCVYVCVRKRRPSARVSKKRARSTRSALKGTFPHGWAPGRRFAVVSWKWARVRTRNLAWRGPACRETYVQDGRPGSKWPPQRGDSKDATRVELAKKDMPSAHKGHPPGTGVPRCLAPGPWYVRRQRSNHRAGSRGLLAP